jgi:hypothetical protein
VNAYGELKASLKEAVAVSRGEKAPARRTVWGMDKNGRPVMLRREAAWGPDVKNDLVKICLTSRRQ